MDIGILPEAYLIDDDDDFSALPSLYCAICAQSHTDREWFTDHLGSTQHHYRNSQRLASLKDGEMYCSWCVVGVEGPFDVHCSTDEDHIQYSQSLGRCFPDLPKSKLKKNREKSKKDSPRASTSKISKSSIQKSCKEKIISTKCIGLSHIHRREDEWFCDICLEKFTCAIEVHCNRAIHAIETIKQYDPDTAFMIKTSASNKNLKKTVTSLIYTKVEEFYEQEKETPEYLRFMLLLDRVQKPVKKEDAPGQFNEGVEEASAISESPPHDDPPQSDDIPEEQLTPQSDGLPEDLHTPQSDNIPEDQLTPQSDDIPKDLHTPQCDDLPEDIHKPKCDGLPEDSLNLPKVDTEEMVSLFEEEDRCVFPTPALEDRPNTNDNVNKNLLDIDTSDNKASPAEQSPVIIGLKFLKKVDGCFYCSLCDVRNLGSSLSACFMHVSHSLHQRLMINLKSSHPVPDYLLHIRSKDVELYFKLIDVEARKIEADERKNESNADLKWRKDLLGVDILPEGAADDEAPSSHGDELDLVRLAATWYTENNTMPDKTSSVKEVVSRTSPLPPRIDKVLVGVSTLTRTGELSFHCTLCNIKFDIKAARHAARVDKHHMLGNLHRKKSLVAAYGSDMEEYLQSRAKKEGYIKMNRIISEGCVALENYERQSESEETELVRAQLLGLKVDELPPLVLQSNQLGGIFDIIKASGDLKTNKGVQSRTSSSKEPVAGSERRKGEPRVKKGGSGEKMEGPEENKNGSGEKICGSEENRDGSEGKIDKSEEKNLDEFRNPSPLHISANEDVSILSFIDSHCFDISQDNISSNNTLDVTHNDEQSADAVKVVEPVEKMTKSGFNEPDAAEKANTSECVSNDIEYDFSISQDDITLTINNDQDPISEETSTDVVVDEAFSSEVQQKDVSSNRIDDTSQNNDATAPATTSPPTRPKNTSIKESGKSSLGSKKRQSSDHLNREDSKNPFEQISSTTKSKKTSSSWNFETMSKSRKIDSQKPVSDDRVPVKDRLGQRNSRRVSFEEKRPSSPKRLPIRNSPDSNDGSKNKRIARLKPYPARSDNPRPVPHGQESERSTYNTARDTLTTREGFKSSADNMDSNNQRKGASTNYKDPQQKRRSPQTSNKYNSEKYYNTSQSNKCYPEKNRNSSGPSNDFQNQGANAMNRNQPSKLKPLMRTNNYGVSSNVADSTQFKDNNAFSNKSERPGFNAKPQGNNCQFNTHPSRSNESNRQFSSHLAGPNDNNGQFTPQLTIPNNQDHQFNNHLAGPNQHDKQFKTPPAGPNVIDRQFNTQPNGNNRQFASHPAVPNENNYQFTSHPTRPNGNNPQFASHPAVPNENNYQFTSQPTRPNENNCQFTSQPTRPNENNYQLNTHTNDPNEMNHQFNPNPTGPHAHNLASNSHPTGPPENHPMYPNTEGTAQYSAAFGVDLESMKNDRLSSALAKVTDIAPISNTFLNHQMAPPSFNNNPSDCHQMAPPSFNNNPSDSHPMARPSFNNNPSVSHSMASPSFNNNPSDSHSMAPPSFNNNPSVSHSVAPPSFNNNPSDSHPMAPPSFNNNPSVSHPMARPSFTNNPSLTHPPPDSSMNFKQFW